MPLLPLLLHPKLRLCSKLLLLPRLPPLLLAAAAIEEAAGNGAPPKLSRIMSRLSSWVPVVMLSLRSARVGAKMRL
jgi:hypothetical protein